MQYTKNIIILFISVLVCIAVIPSSYYKKAISKVPQKPVKTILYIGNSHTFVNDVPFWVKIILEKIDKSYEYSYESITQGGVGVKYHWDNPEVQKALEKKYDFVIIQPRSGEIISDKTNKALEFHKYGSYLLKKAIKTSPKVALYQPWIPLLVEYRLLMNKPMGDNQINQLREMLYNIQNRHYANLAHNTKTDVIPVGQSWHTAEKHCPTITLVGDDKHHTNIQGAYLTALTIARYINNNKFLQRDITLPSDISTKDAQCLIEVVNLNI